MTQPQTDPQTDSPTDPQTQHKADNFLRNLWYFAVPGRRLGRGRTMAKRMLGERLLLGRDGAGRPFALADICPHRGIPLSYGRFDGAEIECCYHGWRFEPGGRCTAIPSLVEGQTLDVSRIRVRRYPCREVQGNVWVFMGERDRGEEDLPAVPEVPEIGARPARIVESTIFPCDIDHAVVGLMDPAHGPFVHRAWWWRSRKSIHEKAKKFVPSERGFTMARHTPSSNSRAYRLLGGRPETEISFQLPGIRIEHVRAGRNVLCGLTAVTPISARETEVNHVIYWTMPWLSPFAPILRPFVRSFLDQDRRIVVKQQEGLAEDPPLMLINDADVPAKWYYQLRREHVRAEAESRPFENPVEARTLRWRS